MKSPSWHLRSRGRIRLCTGILVLLTCGAPAWAYKKDGLNIYVQSEVADRGAQATPAASDDRGRIKTYFLAPPLEEKSTLRLIKPVDPAMMAQEVEKVLAAKGYRPVVHGETPDMTITVLYGRGWIHNPYPSPEAGADWNVRDVKKLENSGAYVPFSSILEGKRQYAAEEKLAIVVTAWAWDPPAMIAHKARRIWRTMMYIDDPDHRDLNNIADKLLAVGAEYFNRETTEPEAEFTKPLPEGHVELGTPTEVKAPSRDGK